MSKEKDYSNILEEVARILEVTGNPYLCKIFDTYKDDERKLIKALRRYETELYVDISEEQETVEEGDEENKSGFAYITINDTIIDHRNIARVELDQEYNHIKHKIEYYLRIFKKYPSPMEEDYIIPFESEEERDRGFELLKAKLRVCKVQIL